MLNNQQFSYASINTIQPNSMACDQSRSHHTANSLPIPSVQHSSEDSKNKMDKTSRRKVQIFDCALTRLAKMGLKPTDRFLNVRVLRDALVYLLNIIACIMYVILEANTFWKYTNSIFIVMATVVGLLLLLLLAVKSKKMFELSKSIRKMIEDSNLFLNQKVGKSLSFLLIF